MRITVTVVVIMFELTGALTYILPTMVSSYQSYTFLVTDSTLDCDSRHKSSRRLFRSNWDR